MLAWWTGALTHSISLPTGRSVTQALKTGEHSSGLPCSLVRKRKWRALGFASSGRGVREVFGYFRSNIRCRRRIYFSGMFEAGLWQQWRLPDWDGMVASAPDSAAVACHLWLRRTFRCQGSGTTSSPRPAGLWTHSLEVSLHLLMLPTGIFPFLNTFLTGWKLDRIGLSSLQLKPDQNTASVLVFKNRSLSSLRKT